MPDGFDFSPIFFGAAITDELLVTAVQAFDAPGVFNRAPELFSACGYFLQIGKQSVNVTAVGAIDFFHHIQIVEVLPVKDDIVLPFNFRDAV